VALSNEIELVQQPSFYHRNNETSGNEKRFRLCYSVSVGAGFQKAFAIACDQLSVFFPSMNIEIECQSQGAS
jgi:hypothetical protein